MRHVYGDGAGRDSLIKALVDAVEYCKTQLPDAEGRTTLETEPVYETPPKESGKVKRIEKKAP